MPIGLICGCGAVFAGGLIGASCGKYISEEMKEVLMSVFGLSAVGNGIMSLIKGNTMPPVILALIVGVFLGQMMELEKRVKSGLGTALRKLPVSAEKINMDEYVTIVAIFCASGFGIYGVLTEGMTGDPSILLSKSIMDLFTAVLFAGTMGAAVSLIAVPQLVIFLALFFLAKLIVPLTTPELLNDFVACGGILTIAAGLRVSKIKDFPLINMLPALILVMPFSAVWGMIF